MFKVIGLSVLVLLMLAPVSLYYGLKVSPISWQIIHSVNSDNGIALKGYDPVSYFISGEPIFGNPDKGLLIDGIVYRFSTDENKLMFKTFPHRYLPQYGGYCAFAISTGFTANSSPQSWLIEGDKLFLFSDDDAKEIFKHQINSNIITKADSEWSNH